MTWCTIVVGGRVRLWLGEHRLWRRVEDEHQGLMANQKEGSDEAGYRAKNALPCLNCPWSERAHATQLNEHSHERDLLCYDGRNYCRTSKSSERPIALHN
jgi:hypothetical protein